MLLLTAFLETRCVPVLPGCESFEHLRHRFVPCLRLCPWNPLRETYGVPYIMSFIYDIIVAMKQLISSQLHQDMFGGIGKRVVLDLPTIFVRLNSQTPDGRRMTPLWQ